MTLRQFYALADRCKSVRDWMNYRTALLCTVMVNLWRSPKSKPAKVEDFMPGVHPKQQTPEQMLAVVQMLNAAHGGNFSAN